MTQHLPAAILKEENYCSMKYEVKQSKSHVSDIFTVLQKAKPDLSLLDYAVHQTNLEQVGLRRKVIFSLYILLIIADYPLICYYYRYRGYYTLNIYI